MGTSTCGAVMGTSTCGAVMGTASGAVGGTPAFASAFTSRLASTFALGFASTVTGVRALPWALVGVRALRTLLLPPLAPPPLLPRSAPLLPLD